MGGVKNCLESTGHVKQHIRSIRQRRRNAGFCFLFIGFLLKMVHWVGTNASLPDNVKINLFSALESYMESVFYHHVAFVSCGTRQQMDLYRPQ